VFPAPGSGASANEPVSDAVYGTEMCRPGWVFLQFLSELENVGVDGARRRIILVTPYFFQQFVAADHSIGILHKKLKRSEFMGR
jgi:hypothetical protein